MSVDHKTYTDEEFALVLRKAAELAEESEVSARPVAGLSLEDMKAIAAEAGLDPALIERASHLILSQTGDSNLRPAGGGLAGRRLTASCPTTMTQERTSHLLSVIRAAMRQQGVGEATSSGLVWSTGSGIVATIHNERGGSRVEVSVNRLFALIPSGVSGLVSALLASVNSNGTPGDAIVSVVIGLTVAIGLWAVLTIRTRKRVVALMDTISRTMTQMGELTAASHVAGGQVRDDETARGRGPDGGAS